MQPYLFNQVIISIIQMRKQRGRAS